MSCPIVSVNKRLALLAFALGLLALVLGDPSKAGIAKIDTKELAHKINSPSSNIEVEKLADWLIQGNADFVLVDLSAAANFESYHLPKALNIQPDDLTGGELARNQKIILYSDDNIKTAQSWFILKANQYSSVYLLKGGIEEWKAKILFPKIPDSIKPEDIAKYEKIKAVSKYFGGQPQLAGGTQPEQRAAVQLPKISSPAVSSPSAKGKPKREGC